MRNILNLPVFFAPLFLAVFLACPEHAFGADAVEKAFSLAKELLGKSENGERPEAAEAETGVPEQASYPGIKNMHIERGGNGSPSVSIYYPGLGNEAIDQDLKTFAQNLADAYEKDLADTYSGEEDKPESYGSWEETCFFAVERPGPDVVSITFNIYSYTGGAHGQLVIEVRNYDLKSGRRLEFGDLFARPEKALTILSEVCSAKLRATLGEDVEEDMLRDGTEPDVNNFSNLSLLPRAVAVEFQPYQVGPWSIGQQRVEVSLEELAPAGPNPLVWPDAASLSPTSPRSN